MKKDFDIIGVLLGVVIGIFLGYLIGTKLDLKNNTVSVKEELNENIEYIYLLQIAKFDNAQGALKYQEVLKNKEMTSIVINEGMFYYIYGGISATKEGLDSIRNKYFVLGYECLVKRELLIDKANSLIDNNKLYSFYTECIHNLYNSLIDQSISISEIYYVNPVNIELFSQLQILNSIKNDVLKQTAQLQTYKLIVDNL